MKDQTKSGKKTAAETAAVKRDSKAIAEGVKGAEQQEVRGSDRASKDELASLPGLTPRDADRIVAERPYANPHQLVTRRVVSQEEQEEHDQIQDRVVVNPRSDHPGFQLAIEEPGVSC